MYGQGKDDLGPTLNSNRTGGDAAASDGGDPQLRRLLLARLIFAIATLKQLLLLLNDAQRPNAAAPPSLADELTHFPTEERVWRSGQSGGRARFYPSET